MARFLSWPLLAVSLVACAILGYGAYYLAGVSWDAVVAYESPYAELGLPEPAAASGVASRTVVVIVDGLRVDASREMGTLNSLRAYGSDFVAIAPQPSLSYPNWTTLLSGAPPYVSGVVTNWHEGAAPVETLFDSAKRAGTRTVFVGPEDFEALYGVKAKCDATYMREWESNYLSDTYVDAALDLAERENPELLVVHLPDVDEAGHAYGGASSEYAAVVARVDADLGRLVEGLQDGQTVFVIVSDHGHIDTGGHGGWESQVTSVPAVIAGPGVGLVSGTALSEDVAPTVAVIAGVAVPRHAVGTPLKAVIRDQSAGGLAPTEAAAVAFDEAAAAMIAAPLPSATKDALQASAAGEDEAGGARAAAAEERQAYDRAQRLRVAALGLLVSLVALAVVGVLSWRALVAGLFGSAAYYAVYNGLFFLVHDYRWSLSAFNSEDLIEGWMNTRLIEAALALLVAVGVAALIYPLLRSEPKGPRGEYLPRWLMLGPATAIVILATLGIQVAWFVWWWGIEPTWMLPDMKWAFKYDLDLIQATAIGFAALVTPAVTYVVGRFHPRVRMANDRR